MSVVVWVLMLAVGLAQATEEPEPLEVCCGVEAPTLEKRTEPEYTQIAREARVQGVVIVSTVIERTGRTSGFRVLKGLPMGLSDSAIEAVRQWEYAPATLDGEAVRVRTNVVVDFRLEPSEEE